MKRWLAKLQGNLSSKLMASYLVVIVVGVATAFLTTELAIPTAFERHMAGMQALMSGNDMPHGMGGMMRSNLFVNFQAAVTESVLTATGAALLSAVVVSMFVAHRIVTPIRQMMQASQRIAAGRYQERVDVPGEDELGQLARSFNQMAMTLEQTELMRRDLIANVAHELRTPLTSIKGYMEGLIDGVLVPEAETYQQVYREADRLQRLVSDLQELSRVEAGAFELNRQPLALADLIRQITERLQPQFEDKKIALQLDLPPDLPPVRADEDRLSQVLLNLIGNALHYTPGGGVVTIKATPAASFQISDNGRNIPDSHVVVTISDTGIGIPAEHLSHLFTRFYRVDKSRSRAGGGSGIGLTIAKHLVEAHGGRIWAESKGNEQGSTFGFSIPMTSVT